MIRLILSLSLLASFSLAKKHISPLPLPDIEVIDLTAAPCDVRCLQAHLENQLPFSLLADYSSKIQDAEMEYQVNVLRTRLSVGFLPDDLSLDDTQMRLAVIMPKKIIGRYALSTSRSILSYLLSRSRNFELEIFDTGDETPTSLQNTLQNIRTKKFENILALLTADGAKNLQPYCEGLNVFIPTINHAEIPGKNSHIIYGGIDYRHQIDTLLYYADNDISVFYDDSSVGRQLTSYASESGKELSLMIPVISTQKYAFKNLIKKNKKRLEESSVILNTPIIKSSLLMSQLTYYKTKPHSLLSTQINYNPSILSLTQEKDRENMFIANSISPSNNILNENNLLLGSDIRFDWINYAVSLGTEHFYFSAFPASSHYFEEKIIDNQVSYDTKIVMPINDQFVTVKE